MGVIEITNGEIQKAELHWYEEHTVDKVKFKRKRICE